MSDDKHLSGMVVCDTHNRRDCPVCWPHDLRPASPTPEQPAQDWIAMALALLTKLGAAACDGTTTYVRNERANGTQSRWHHAADCRRCALVAAPPAQTQQGLSEALRKILWLAEQAVDATAAEAARQGGNQLGREAAHAGRTNLNKLRESILALNPDKQPSPSAAPAQEWGHCAEHRTEHCLLHHAMTCCLDAPAAPPASPEGALREALCFESDLTTETGRCLRNRPCSVHEKKP